jgi:hypothetical protein
MSTHEEPLAAWYQRFVLSDAIDGRGHLDPVYRKRLWSVMALALLSDLLSDGVSRTSHDVPSRERDARGHP